MFNKKRYDFIEICKMSQVGLKNYLEKELLKYYEDFVVGDGYIYAKGTTPVLLTAHLDTVHKELVKKVVFSGKGDKLQVSSPQGIGGDDRCGVWIILEVLRNGYRPSILFCEDEESGGIGSNKFVKTDTCRELEDLKFFIELDRANAKDAVFYDCGNEDFKNFIKEATGYKEAYGSFSDISHLSPATDVASVNLSCGYYKAHTTQEYVVLSEMYDTRDVVFELLNLDYNEVDNYDFQEEMYGYGYGFGRHTSYGGYGSYYGTPSRLSYDSYYIWYVTEDDKTDVYETFASNEIEALGAFFMDNETRCFNDVIDIETEDEFGYTDYSVPKSADTFNGSLSNEDFEELEKLVG